MKTKLLGLALALAVLAATGGATVQTVRADDEDLLEVIDMDSKRDLLVVRCEDRYIQAEQIDDGLMVLTCGARILDDTVRTRAARHRR